MKCKDLAEYFSKFPPDDVAFVVADTKKRLHYIVSEQFAIDEIPAIMIDTHETEPLDDCMSRLKEG